MNAVLEHQSSAAEQSQPLEGYQDDFPGILECWTQISNHLASAALLAEPSDRPDTVRLLNCAAAAAGRVAANPEISGDEIEEVAFDVEALVIASLRVEDAVLSPARFALLHQVVTLMLGTCGWGEDTRLALLAATATTEASVSVYGWDNVADKIGSDEAVIINPNASVGSLVNWALGQFRQVNELQRVITSSGENESVIEPSKLLASVVHFNDQAVTVLRAAMDKITEQEKRERS